MVFGLDGALYGASQFNTLFKVNRDGSAFKTILQLPAVVNGGGTPSAHLLLGNDGFFYSTTKSGGIGNNGVVFRVKPDGSAYFELHRFLGSGSNDGAEPRVGLVFGSNGALYGVTFYGGINNKGTIFTVNTDGGNYSVLHHFQGAGSGDGDGPHARLLEGIDGVIYGTTQFGGIPTPVPNGDSGGTIFKINRDGSDYMVLHRFDRSEGDTLIPYAYLIEGTNGALYGTTLGTNKGTLFRVNKDGSDFRVLHAFGLAPMDGRNPHSGLLKASDGALYGTTWFGGTNGQGSVYRINEDGSGYQLLASFLSVRTRQTPRAPLLQGIDGRLYCATEDSGSTNFGSIFSIDRNGGEFRLLHDFGVVTNDGRIPNALCEGNDGLLYGTTQLGGTNGNGTVFRVNKTGAEYTVLRSFLNSTDGSSCKARLIEASDGWLYGCSNLGGSFGRGTIFKLQKDGSGFAVLWNFGAITNDGAAPQGELLEGPDDALYGTTRAAGAVSRGAVFKINKNGSAYTNLHHFTGGGDGQSPQAGLLVGSDGMLYGTTSSSAGGGTVFALNPDGSGYTVLRMFGGAVSDPRTLRGRLVEGPDGLLYGTTYSGGANAYGTLFAINKDGTGFQVLWHFGSGIGDGRNPVAGPTLLDDGTLAGSTEAGGDLGVGTFWRLDPREVVLSIERQGGNTLIRWPTTATSDRLESADGLSMPGRAWSQETVTVVTNANRYEASVPLSGMQRFLRVRREWR